jgi:hypothetical protein
MLLFALSSYLAALFMPIVLLPPTSFRLGARYSVAVVGDEAYFWGCFGPSKYNKGMDDVLSPKYDSGLTDFDDICCGSFTFVRKGKTVRIYKR